MRLHILICKKFIYLPDSSKVELLLYGSSDLSFTQNTSIINASINYIIKSERFKGNHFWTYFNPKLHLILSRDQVPLSYVIIYLCLYHFHRWLRDCYCVVGCFFMLNFLYFSHMQQCVNHLIKKRLWTHPFNRSFKLIFRF